MSSRGDSSDVSRKCLVVDASVIIKWHVEEVHSAAARFLLEDLRRLNCMFRILRIPRLAISSGRKSSVES